MLSKNTLDSVTFTTPAGKTYRLTQGITTFVEKGKRWLVFPKCSFCGKSFTKKWTGNGQLENKPHYCSTHCSNKSNSLRNKTDPFTGAAARFRKYKENGLE